MKKKPVYENQVKSLFYSFLFHSKKTDTTKSFKHEETQECYQMWNVQCPRECYDKVHTRKSNKIKFRILKTYEDLRHRTKMINVKLTSSNYINDEVFE